MEISILGFKLNVEILILIGVIYLVLVGHLFCSCCSFNVMENFQDASGSSGSFNRKFLKKIKQLKTQVAAGGPTTSDMNTSVSTEGFTGANINNGQSSPYDLNTSDVISTSSWGNQDMTIMPGKPLSDGVKAFMARPEQPIPLPEGEMFMFANTAFKPECCPNTYSNGSGCACMTGKQYNYLITRGSNNVPYSEY
jgi:hypothetical protein